MSNSVIQNIADDLGIVNSPRIPVDRYNSMVIYSALGEWLKTICYDRKSIDDDFEIRENRFATKNHITSQLKKLLDAYIYHYPGIKPWFFPEFDGEALDASKPVIEIRRRIIDAGFMVSGHENTLQHPPAKCVCVAPEMYLYRGRFDLLPDQVIGLGTYLYNNDKKIPEVSVEEMFNLPNETPDRFVDEYLQSIKSKLEVSRNQPEQREYFNPWIKLSMSKAWSHDYPKNVQITVYKDTDQDFGIIEFDGEKYRTFAFPKSFIELNETRRLCYGIWKRENRIVEASVKKIDSTYCSIKLPSFLPKKEQNVLYLLAWPESDYRESPSYITTYEVLPVIEQLLNNLCIGVKHV